MYNKHLQLLNLLLEATQSRSIAWRREGSETHHARLAGLRCTFRFSHVWPETSPEVEADFVEVTIGLETFRFFCGSEGFGLTTKILACAYPEVKRHYDEMIVRLDDLISRIQPALKSGTQPQA